MQPDHFSALAPELRNRVYNFVLQYDVGVISPQLSISCQSGLDRVCRQSREEYYPMLKARVMNVEARGIVVHVKDFNFAHFIDFLNGLTPAVYHKLRTAMVKLELHFTEHFWTHPRIYPHPCETSLMAWVNHRAEAREKKAEVPALLYVFAETIVGQEKRTKPGIGHVQLSQHDKQTIIVEILNNLVRQGIESVEPKVMKETIWAEFGIPEPKKFPKQMVLAKKGRQYISNPMKLVPCKSVDDFFDNDDE